MTNWFVMRWKLWAGRLERAQEWNRRRLVGPREPEPDLTGYQRTEKWLDLVGVRYAVIAVYDYGDGIRLVFHNNPINAPQTTGAFWGRTGLEVICSGFIIAGVFCLFINALLGVLLLGGAAGLYALSANPKTTSTGVVVITPETIAFNDVWSGSDLRTIPRKMFEGTHIAQETGTRGRASSSANVLALPIQVLSVRYGGVATHIFLTDSHQVAAQGALLINEAMRQPLKPQESREVRLKEDDDL